jgi:hypothetical protein
MLHYADCPSIEDIVPVRTCTCDSRDPTVLKNDPVSRPAHYTRGKIEVADFIDDQDLPRWLAMVVKYVCRAGKKEPEKYKQDLEKARWYLSREIDRCAS